MLGRAQEVAGQAEAERFFADIEDIATSMVTLAVALVGPESESEMEEGKVRDEPLVTVRRCRVRFTGAKVKAEESRAAAVVNPGLSGGHGGGAAAPAAPVLSLVPPCMVTLSSV